MMPATLHFSNVARLWQHPSQVLIRLAVHTRLLVLEAEAFATSDFRMVGKAMRETGALTGLVPIAASYPSKMSENIARPIAFLRLEGGRAGA